LPLVNAPMINYTLTWLESAGIEEVFVFCCAHSKQVINYLEKSEWFNQPNFTVTTIESQNSVSAGDALRVIYERNVVCIIFISFFINLCGRSPATVNILHLYVDMYCKT
jgi:translation initiation factor eIF-2B subunit epsilon